MSKTNTEGSLQRTPAIVEGLARYKRHYDRRRNCSLRTCLEGNLRHRLGKGQGVDFVDYEAIQAILVLTLLVYMWKCQQPGTSSNKHPICISDFYTLLRGAQRWEMESPRSLSPIQAPTEGSST